VVRCASRGENRVKKLSTMAAVALLSLTVAGAISAEAQQRKGKEIPTRLAIKFMHETYTASFSGNVKSSSPSCVGGRKVSVIRRANGSKIATDVSSNNGKWRVDLQGVPKSGAYFASTPKKKLNTKKACGAAQSPTVQVP